MDDFRIKSIKAKTLKDIIYNKIKELILTNNFPVNYYVTEQNLSKQLEVSRTPLREAMIDLVNEELIEFKPRKGYKVKKFSDKEIQQIFLLRKVIETEIVNPLLLNVNDHNLKSLYNIIEQQKQCIEIDDGFNFMNLDKAFHREMFLISEYNIFLKSYDLFHNLTILIGSQALRKTGRMKEVIIEHQNILSAIKEKNENKLKEYIDFHLMETKHMYDKVKKEY